MKGSNYLETLSQTKYVVFDKTGTMTQGVFEVAVFTTIRSVRKMFWNTQHLLSVLRAIRSARVCREHMEN